MSFINFSQGVITVVMICVCRRGHSNHSSNSSNTTELKANSSPDLSPLPGPVALVTSATSRASNQPADGDIAVKNETDQKKEGENMEGGKKFAY